MQLSATVDSFARWTKDVERDIAKVNTRAMQVAGSQLKADLRAQVERAGLGTKLARTWQGQTYPKGRVSIQPAGYVYSKAPDIIRSFATGATIRPVNGAKYLWLPTDAVPRARGRRGSSRRMTPDQVESAFNQDLIILRGKKGNLLAFVDGVKSRSGKGFKPATPGRLKQARQRQLVLMFTLVRVTKMPKLLDLDAPLRRATQILEAELSRDT